MIIVLPPGRGGSRADGCERTNERACHSCCTKLSTRAMSEESAADEVLFIDDVSAFLQNKDPDTCIKQLQAQHSRFSMQEARSTRRRPSLAC
jgi:hypothetical protein